MNYSHCGADLIRFPGGVAERHKVVDTDPSYCPGSDLPCADVRKANAARPALHVVPANHCLVHDVTYDRLCAGCRADELAGEVSA